MTFPTRNVYDAEHFKPSLAPFDRRLGRVLHRDVPALEPRHHVILRRFGLDVMPLTARTDVYEGASLIVHGERYIVRAIDFAGDRITLGRARADRKHTLTVTPARLAELLTAEETRHAAA